MLFPMVHPIPERFLIISQHAQEWIVGVWVNLGNHYVALLIRVSNLKEDQSAVVLVVHQAQEAGSAVHCQERNEIENHRIENRDWHSREFLGCSFFYSHPCLLQEFERNHQLLRPRFRKKMLYLADHRPEKNSDEYTESLLWLYLFYDRITSSAKLILICCITNIFVSAPNLPHSSVCFRLKQPKLVKKWYPSM